MLRLLFVLFHLVMVSCSEENVVQTLPADVQRDLLLSEANQAIEENRYDEAASIYDQIQKLSLEHGGDFFARYSQLLFEAGRFEDARRAVLKYLRVEGINGRWYSQAILLLSRISSSLKQKSQTPIFSKDEPDLESIAVLLEEEPEPEKAKMQEIPTISQPATELISSAPQKEDLNAEAKSLFMLAMSNLRSMPSIDGNSPREEIWKRWEALRRAVELWERILRDYRSTTIALYLQSPKNPLSFQMIRREMEELSRKFFMGSVLQDELLKTDFLLLPSDDFMMGGGDREDQLPSHRVLLTRSVYLMRTEVTQSQWQMVMGTNPAWFSSCGPTCPVERVSHDDVQKFIGLLNQKAGREIYRLPTEAEWEYAAQKSLPTTRADEWAWYDDNSSGVTHASCLKEKTGPGFCDLFGNVWEWVADDYDYETYIGRVGQRVEDPLVLNKGRTKVFRGGSFDFTSEYLSARRRYDDLPSFKAQNIGFRLVRTSP